MIVPLRMYRASRAVAAFFLIGCAGVSRAAPTEAPLLALVNGDSITMRDLDRELAPLRSKIEGGEKVALPEAEPALRRLIQNRLLEQEGYRIGADSSASVKAQVHELVRHKSILMLLDSVSALVPPPDPEAMDSVMGGENTIYHVSHILVAEEATARSLLDTLAAGVPFADLARRHSIDSLSASRGGDLGWARKGVYVPPFEEALAGLAPGELAGPVETEHGWHIIRLAEKRTETVGQSAEMREAVHDAIMKERVKKAVGAYILQLRKKHGVVVDDSLLATLDYATADPSVYEHLKTSDEALAEAPGLRLTVRGLTRNIRFQYFHGLEGKPEAPAIRDRMFDEYLTEALLARESARLGYDERPEIVRAGRQLERQLAREAVLELILGFSFDPDEEEVRRFHAAHGDLFSPEPRIKADAVLLETEEDARLFHEKVEEGAKLRWLAARTPGIAETAPEFLGGWVDAAALGISGHAVTAGAMLGPSRVAAGWIVGRVTAVEEVEPTPLAQCRSRVVAEMKRRRGGELLHEALDRLEGASRIEIVPGAAERISKRFDAWESMAGPPAGGSPDGTAGKETGR